MNDQNEKIPPSEDKNQEHPRKPGKNSSQNFRKRGSVATAILLGITFILLYVLVNISTFSGIISNILSVCAPIILGVALAYLLNPLLKFYEFKVFKWIKKKRILRGLSLFMTYVTVGAFLTACALVLIPQLIQSASDLTAKFDGYLQSTADLLNSVLQKMFAQQGDENTLDKEKLLSAITGFISDSGDLVSGILNYIVQYGSGLVVSLKNMIFAFFISIYVLISKERLKAQVNKFTSAVFHTRGQKRFYRYVSLCDRTFSGFFVGKIIDSLIIGAITLVTLLIFRMPYALLVSAIVCVTNVIPVFGPFIGAIPSFFIIFIVSPPKAFLFLVLILIIQQLDGNVIGPKVLGDSTGISTLSVMAAILVMGDIFGVVGMVIGVPLFAVIIAVVKELVEAKLKKKNLPTETAEYYAEDSLVNPHEVRETVTQRMFHRIGRLISRIFRGKKSNKNSDNQENKDAKETRKDSDNQS